ncbi:MAG: protein-ADP-ribose hydrolase [Clostridia bacterium]|nr:protein-ADP-ribose hydrolase [Clostridia bacterium]
MNQAERRRALIDALLNERRGYEKIDVPADEGGQRTLLRSLFNVRMPAPASERFLKIQDEYLKEEIRLKGIADEKDILPLRGRLCLWQGDITLLKCDAIVNAANSGMTGCYRPMHNCIDNCIHTFSGVQLRYKCALIMEEQGYDEPTGQAKITPAYNLPSSYIMHTVGPVVGYQLKPGHEEQLASCYTACLRLTDKNALKSVAFPCISTGVFGYPKEQAAATAVKAVSGYLAGDTQIEKVIFNVFSDEDRQIYEKLLKT